MTMKNAIHPRPSFGLGWGLGLALLLAGCGALPDKPARSTLYDFGPGLAAAATAANPPAAALPTLALAEVESNTRLDSTQILYRLGYADANELRPYGQSRWSLPPAQLLRQRLRDAFTERRTVLGPEESATIARAEGRVPDTLRISLDEFSHYFESAGSSVGLVRLRATLIRGTTGGDRRRPRAGAAHLHREAPGPERRRARRRESAGRRHRCRGGRHRAMGRPATAAVSSASARERPCQ
jgi:cholesterol transport system auxiliary component